MTDANVEVLKRLFDAWNARDPEGFRQCLDPDFEFRTSGTFPGFSPSYRGFEAFAGYWRAMIEQWEYFCLKIERFVVEEDCVATETRIRGRGRESGVEVELPFAHAAVFRNRRLLLLAARRTFEEALAVMREQLEHSRCAAADLATQPETNAATQER